MASGGAGGMGPAMPKRDALRRYPLFVPEADDLHSAQKLAQVTECDYGLPEFWDRKYTKDAKHGMEYAFDWYTGKDHIEAYVMPMVGEYDSPRILIVGCGNSGVAGWLYDAGWTDITCCDISAVVINQMKAKYAGREGIAWVVADARRMDAFVDDAFDVIIDKGCADSLFAGMGGAKDAIKMWLECYRVLARGGRYLYFSLAGPNARRLHLQEVNWTYDTTFISGSAASSVLYVVRTKKGERTPLGETMLTHVIEDDDDAFSRVPSATDVGSAAGSASSQSGSDTRRSTARQPSRVGSRRIKDRPPSRGTPASRDRR